MPTEQERPNRRHDCPRCHLDVAGPCRDTLCPIQDTPAPSEEQLAPKWPGGGIPDDRVVPNRPGANVHGLGPDSPQGTSGRGDSPPQAPTEQLLQFFEYGHLPEKLRSISQPFAIMAHDLVAILPRNPERTVALRKLLEARDCAVRAAVFKL